MTLVAHRLEFQVGTTKSMPAGRRWYTAKRTECRSTVPRFPHVQGPCSGVSSPRNISPERGETWPLSIYTLCFLPCTRVPCWCWRTYAWSPLKTQSCALPPGPIQHAVRSTLFTTHGHESRVMAVTCVDAKHTATLTNYDVTLRQLWRMRNKTFKMPGTHIKVLFDLPNMINLGDGA